MLLRPTPKAYQLTDGNLAPHIAAETDQPHRAHRAIGAAPREPTAIHERAQELNKLAESGLLVPLKSQVRERSTEQRDSAFSEMCRRLREEIRQERKAPST